MLVLLKHYIHKCIYVCIYACVRAYILHTYSTYTSHVCTMYTCKHITCDIFLQIIIAGFHMATLSHILIAYHTKKLIYSKTNAIYDMYIYVQDLKSHFHSKIGLGKKCLARHTDGLWHPAIFR